MKFVKSFYLAAFLIICSTIAIAQSDGAQAPNLAAQEKLEVQTKYDRFEDFTLISVGPFVLNSDLIGAIGIAFVTGGNGKAPTSFASPVYRIVATWKERQDSLRVIFLIDGERLEFPDPDLVTRDTYQKGVVEQWQNNVSLDFLEKIASGKKVEARFGKVEVLFKDEQLRALKKFVETVKGFSKQ